MGFHLCVPEGQRMGDSPKGLADGELQRPLMEKRPSPKGLADGGLQPDIFVLRAFLCLVFRLAAQQGRGRTMRE